MKRSSSLLRDDPLPWLLEKENPSVRYFALRELLGRPADHREVRSAQRAIMREGPVPALLERQNPDGTWGEPARFYTNKYRGTTWQLIILASLGADGGDERIRRACEFILRHSQDEESGGFSIRSRAKGMGGNHGEVIPCLTGNLVWSLLRSGYGRDPRVRRSVEWMVRYSRFDDGVAQAPAGWPYDRWEICWGRHTCHMGVVKSLKALAEIPPESRTKRERETIAKGAGFLLLHHIHKRSHDLSKVSKPGWKKLGFPLMYQTDILEILNILTDLGYRDERMSEAVELLLSKQNERGRWMMENSFNDRTLVPVEEKGKESHWITLYAWKVIRRFYGAE